jgi:hypothetical protein
MISSANRRRPRRFFGLRGVVRRLRRADGGDDGPSVRPRRRPSTDADTDRALQSDHALQFDRALQSERARFAAGVDLELRLACRSEAAMRRELGCAARAFVRGRPYPRLGFVRLADYARERLGVSARTLQSAAWLAARLDALPAVSRAYDRSELSWAQARTICKVAVVTDEEQWLALARRSTVEALERLVRSTRQPHGVPADPDGEPNEIDGEPAVRWRFVCPARVRALWRRALELASRAAGEPLAEWRAAEIVAAEGSSGRPAGTSMGDRALLAALRLAHRARRRRGGAGDSDADRHSDPADLAASSDRLPCEAVAVCAPPSSSEVTASTEPPQSSEVTASTEPPPSSDPFALDARLVEAMRVLRTAEPRIGRLLRVVVDHHLHRSFGHAAFEDYVRERLGISVRKAWALLKLEKATLRSDDFGRAYRDGRVSWVRALSLLPVLDRTNAAAWLARAESVTVRRLNDEVEWVLASRDALGPGASLAPPPVDSRLPSPAPPVDSRLPSPVVWQPPASSSAVVVPTAEQCRDLSLDPRLQIRAHADGSLEGAADWHSPSAPDRRLEVCDAEIRFTAPASVIALLRDVLDAFAEPCAPRWTALERLLRHVITHWESTPRHHDPVFARDGWRCTVPACSSRRNLHDHHIRFRSRGGDNRRDNRTVVCAAHHLHGIHDGTIRASGVAPHAIEWALGVRQGAPPFLVSVGDRYCPAETANTAMTDQSAALL